MRGGFSWYMYIGPGPRGPRRRPSIFEGPHSLNHKCCILIFHFLGYFWFIGSALHNFKCTLFCNSQSRARTHTVLLIGLYELLGNPTTGAWVMDFVSSSPLFSTTPPFLQNFHINHFFFKIFIIIRFFFI